MTLQLPSSTDAHRFPLMDLPSLRKSTPNTAAQTQERVSTVAASTIPVPTSTTSVQSRLKSPSLKLAEPHSPPREHLKPVNNSTNRVFFWTLATIGLFAIHQSMEGDKERWLREMQELDDDTNLVGLQCAYCGNHTVPITEVSDRRKFLSDALTQAKRAQCREQDQKPTRLEREACDLYARNQQKRQLKLKQQPLLAKYR